MKALPWLLLVLSLVLLLPVTQAQTKIVIAAGTPEDRALQDITSETDAQKRTAMLEDFVQKFASNPAAVAYGNWQLAQQFIATDPRKALAYGDKALAAMPDVVDILISQVDIAQQLKDSPKVVDYAVRGATVINSVKKTEAAAAEHPGSDQAALQSSYQYLEAAGYNAIAADQNPRQRVQEIERYMGGFPDSKFNEQLATVAVLSLQETKDSAGLVAFGDKMLARNPKDIRLLTVLASAYAGDPAHTAKAAGYAHRAIELQKADSTDPTDRKLAGVAHSVLGHVLLQENKFPAAAAELKTATGLLKDSPEDLAGACYYLGFAYAKMERAADAIRALTQASGIEGPYQQPSQELLARIKAARSRR
jgi:tetratricopeptide (TPR) repeat protein